MGTLSAALFLPSKFNSEDNSSFFLERARRRSPKYRNHSIVPVARLFGPAIFEASKLKVLFLGAEKKHPGKFPRTYTLTHSDITAKLTLAISQTINNSQLNGWYNRLQRDEVVAEWKKIKGKMSLHVHCHISDGHFMLDLLAKLRYYIFSKELPVVLKAFVHGDEDLFKYYPELVDALVWVYFHSSIPEFNQVQCWGPLNEASSPYGRPAPTEENPNNEINDTNALGFDTLKPCPQDCSCCFPPISSIPWPTRKMITLIPLPQSPLIKDLFYRDGGFN